MKGLHEYTSSTYAILFSITFFGASIPMTDAQITMFDTFSGNEYLIFMVVALGGGIGVLCKTKAFQYEKVGKLIMLSYLSILFTFLFDIILIGT